MARQDCGARPWVEFLARPAGGPASEERASMWERRDIAAEWVRGFARVGCSDCLCP